MQKSAEPPIKTRDELSKIDGVSHDYIQRLKLSSGRGHQITGTYVANWQKILCSLIKKNIEEKIPKR